MKESKSRLQEPTADFIRWWEPDGFNPQTGAQTGGHPEAYRKCVRPDTLQARHYGVKTIIAFNTRRYREEYHQWLREGQPSRGKDYDGTAASPGKVKSCLAEIREIMKGSEVASNPF